MSKNAARRHLNPGQRSTVTAEYEEFYRKARKEAHTEAARQTTAKRDAQVAGAPLPADLPEAPKPPRCERESREKAAKATGASGRGVQQAKDVKRNAPDLHEKSSPVTSPSTLRTSPNAAYSSRSSSTPKAAFSTAGIGTRRASWLESRPPSPPTTGWTPAVRAGRG